MADRDPKAAILARRARFVAASLTTLGLGGCDSPKARDPSVWSSDAGAETATIEGKKGKDPDAPDDVVSTGGDIDKDGVPDGKDQCPTYWGPPPSGCPMPCLSVAMPVPRIEIVQKVFFESKKAIVRSTAAPILKEIASVLKDNPQITLEIDGHTDATEAPDVAKARAEAVRDFLVKDGVATTRLSIKGLGATVPEDTNETEGGRENNRRVSFVRTDNASP